MTKRHQIIPTPCHKHSSLLKGFFLIKKKKLTVILKKKKIHVKQNYQKGEMSISFNTGKPQEAVNWNRS